MKLTEWLRAFGIVNDLASGSGTSAPGGRLSVESAVPISSSDQAAKGTLYYVPFVHDKIMLWSGSAWVEYSLGTPSLTLTGLLTNGKPHGVFMRQVAGVPTMDVTAWTDDTTPGSAAITLQDGRYCKSGDKTRLEVGMIYATGTGQTEDKLVQRYVWNRYNQIPRLASFSTGGVSQDHAISVGGTLAEWNGSAHIEFVVGHAINTVVANGSVQITQTNANSLPFVGLSTSNTSPGREASSAGIAAAATGSYSLVLQAQLGAGKRAIYGTERAFTSASNTAWLGFDVFING